MKAMIDMTILSPAGTIYDGRVSHATFPGETGAFAVYPSHAPIIATLAKGDVIYFPEEGGKQSFSIRNGFAEIKNDRATVCVEAERRPAGKQK